MAKSGTDLQRIGLTAAALALFAVLGLLAWALMDVLLMLFLGVLLAIALRFAAGLVQRFTPIVHPWSLVLVLTLLLATFALSLVWLVPALVDQIGDLIEQVAVASEQLQTVLTEGPLGDRLPSEVTDDLNPTNAIPSLQQMLNRLSGAFAEGFGLLANLLFVLFTALFLAADAPRYRASLVQLVPPAGRPRARQVIDHVVEGLKLWLLGRLFSMVLITIVIGVGLHLMGVPLALALGVLTGLFEFIPVVGPLLSAVPAILIGFATGPMMALYVAVFYLVVQQLEGNVITPLVQLKTASLPPVLTLTAVVALGLLFGPLGVLVATPLALVAMILVQELYIHDVLERQPQSDNSAKCLNK